MTTVLAMNETTDILNIDLSLPYKVADLKSADLGRKEMALSENEMPG